MAYSSSSKGKEVGSKAKKKWKGKDLLEKLAAQLVDNAVKAGRLKPQPCERCGSRIRVYGHLDDYCRPLDVRWLCPKCLAEMQREKNETDTR